MAHWTEQTVFTFHAEKNVDKHDAAFIASQVEFFTELPVMVKDYTGTWEGAATAGFEITFIAKHDATDDEIESVFHKLNRVIKDITGNNCLMATRNKTELYCECS